MLNIHVPGCRPNRDTYFADGEPPEGFAKGGPFRHLTVCWFPYRRECPPRRLALSSRETGPSFREADIHFGHNGPPRSRRLSSQAKCDEPTAPQGESNRPLAREPMVRRPKVRL